MSSFQSIISILASTDSPVRCGSAVITLGTGFPLAACRRKLAGVHTKLENMPRKRAGDVTHLGFRPSHVAHRWEWTAARYGRAVLCCACFRCSLALGWTLSKAFAVLEPSSSSRTRGMCLSGTAWGSLVAILRFHSLTMTVRTGPR